MQSALREALMQIRKPFGHSAHKALRERDIEHSAGHRVFEGRSLDAARRPSPLFRVRLFRQRPGLTPGARPGRLFDRCKAC